MLIRFSSNAAGGITMFGDVALQLVNAMTGQNSEEGALKGGDIEEALVRLKQRLQRKDAPPETPHEDLEDAEDEDEDEAPIDLSVRAAPLLEMLSAAAEEVKQGDGETYVMWQRE